MEKMIKKKLDWGVTKPFVISFIENEIFNLNCYESVYPVQKDDIVLDIGASIGPFTWKIMDKASKVHIVEPMIDLIPTIKKNTNGFPVNIINSALSYENGEVKFTDICINNFEPKIVKTVNFKTLLKENNITKLDFIKIDCEGGEYHLFRDENMEFLKTVRNIVGEFHLLSKEHIIEFRYFRDKYLTQFNNYEIRSIDNLDIKWDLFNDNFLNYYEQIMVHISNEK
tara:strand:+ start:31 stop:708 length:678 start_codon:yes stop_codon:yes gene_type:complete